MMAASSNIVFKIAAKPLKAETWLLLSAYRNSLLLYATVFLTTYGLAAIHALQTDRHIVYDPRL